VNKKELQRSMYEITAPSVPQRIVLAAIAGILVLFSCGLLDGPGIVMGGWLGWTLNPGDIARRL
jgi:hypothetical protein